MNSFQYVTSAGATKNFDAPDQDSAMRMLSSFADRDPSSGVRMVTAPATAQPPAVQPGQGAAWNPGAPPAGGTGDTPPAAAPVLDPDQQARDSAAKDLGYTTFDDFLKDVTAKPDKSTEQFYNDAYTTAGLPDLLNQISGKKNALNQALGTVNDNPWYDEAFRRGEASRLQTLAGNDIKNLQDEYQLRLGNVHDLVARETADLAQTSSLAKTKLDYLHQRIQEAQATAKETAAEKKAADNAAATAAKDATAAAKLQTVTAPTTSNVYQYDPTTKEFKLVQKAVPKPVTPRGGGGGGGTSAPKPFKFSAKQLLTLQTRGLQSSDANGILKDIQAGHDLESIRQNMKAQGLNPQLLDSVMGFVDPAHNKVK